MVCNCEVLVSSGVAITDHNDNCNYNDIRIGCSFEPLCGMAAICQ